jgi:hypothetical protein
MRDVQRYTDIHERIREPEHRYGEGQRESTSMTAT